MIYSILPNSDVEHFKGYLTTDTHKMFNKDNMFYIGALDEENNEIAGVAAFLVGNGAELLSIFVAEKYRRQHIGKGMINEMLSLLKELLEPEERYIRAVCDDKENVSDFFVKCGFAPFYINRTCTFMLKAFILSNTLKKVAKPEHNSGIVPLKRAGRDKIREFQKKLYKRGMKYNLLSDQRFNRFSYVYMHNGKITGCIILGDTQEAITIEYIYLLKGTGDTSVILELILRALYSALRVYPEDKKVKVIDVDNNMMEVFDYCGVSYLDKGKIWDFVLM